MDEQSQKYRAAYCSDRYTENRDKQFCNESQPSLETSGVFWVVLLHLHAWIYVEQVGLQDFVSTGADLFNIMHKEFIKLIRKRLSWNIWGKHSISEFAHHLTTEAEEFPRIITVYNFMAKIIVHMYFDLLKQTKIIKYNIWSRDAVVRFIKLDIKITYYKKLIARNTCFYNKSENYSKKHRIC